MTVRERYVVTIVGSFFLALLLLPAGVRVYEVRQFQITHRKISDRIGDLKTNVPTGVVDRQWRQSVERVQAAFWNIAFDETYVSTEELISLKTDINGIISKRAVSGPRLLWEIYNRISATNSTTRKNGEKWRRDVEEELVDCLGPAAAENE
jgi:hypothetical protein